MANEHVIAVDESNFKEIVLQSEGPVLVDCRISPDSNVLPMIPPGGSVADIKEDM